MAYISRDPFARTELHRTMVPRDRRTDCQWCGFTNGGKYRYHIVPDSIRTVKHQISGAFCSIGCMRAYHS